MPSQEDQNNSKQNFQDILISNYEGKPNGTDMANFKSEWPLDKKKLSKQSVNATPVNPSANIGGAGSGANNSNNNNNAPQQNSSGVQGQNKFGNNTGNNAGGGFSKTNSTFFPRWGECPTNKYV